ncbi:MAG TPA: HPr family phosphocarrier protein [Alphaproteobacteria bacterium]|jgi:phosphocarrier protein HPr|nr:HPr family phosphocarrier protein [Alphaproteobacteria bacterium]
MANEEIRARGAVSQTITVCNQRGLHARAAARFVKMAGGYDAAITVTAKGTTVPGLSIMGLMMLAAGPGTDLEIAASGEDATAAVAALAKLVADRFDESE